MNFPANFRNKYTPGSTSYGGTRCLDWTRSLQTKGYGCAALADGSGRNGLAHRLAWMYNNGPIPNGLTVDHLCCNKRCINIQHMELVTRGENTRRANKRRAKERMKVRVMA